MKKILSLLGAITLIGTSITNLVACNHFTQQELEKIKEDNSKIINDIKLEWMAPQEKPFKQLDNKYYFVVWRGNKKDDWRIIKLIHNELKIGKIFDKYNQYTLELRQETGYPFDFTLYVRYSSSWAPADWESDNGTYFKSVYRWNSDKNIPNLVVDSKTGEIKDES
ncbi:lipoprotein [Spiroplasma endosymbiont of Seladonia tumulorum]|uniref:lipoprotein n=1 Tax=Spiroplasma endosymbiont of Seladonia tumulorum TaxID=3066321 RepID=UPI0030CE4C9B